MSAQTIYQPIKPTVLMVKKHNTTGKLYLCKTERVSEAHSYLGSGIDWKKHLQEFGEDVSTIWVSDVFTDTSIKDVALKLSQEHDVSKSKLWENRVDEDGLMGGDRSEHIDYEKQAETLSKTLSQRDPEITKTITQKRAKLISKGIKNNPEKRKQRDQNASKTFQDPVWKETKGKEGKEKEMKTKNSKEWKETKGKEAKKKLSSTWDIKKNRPIVSIIRTYKENFNADIHKSFWSKSDDYLEALLKSLEKEFGQIKN